jgi:MFS superfamily sulfate permease-like transporter
MKWSDVGPLLIGAVGIILVSLTDTIATATNFASRRGDEVDPDQEMVGIGTSNVAADSSGVCRLRQRLPRSRG